MRVQEKDSESCAKMTEEMSMNGGPDIPSGSKRGFGHRHADGSPQSPNLTAATTDDRSSSLAGGRLKFFKDGKFILELSHRKEGERTSWVPVPKKTYWPPPGAAGTPRQESSTSLSVSDDNSSVQSSPWQRDHCWKQNTPRHNVNKEMAFFMRPPHQALNVRSVSTFKKTISKKRRCPYDTVKLTLSNSIDSNNIKIRSTYKRIGPNPARLTLIIQTLFERVRGLSISESVPSSSSVSNHVTSANCSNTSRLDPSIVSPRKRILREMERVSLEDLANSKRQRARPVSSSSHMNNNGSGGNCTVTCQTQVLPLPPPQSTAKGSVSNYSITSLLGPMDETSPTGPESEPSFLRTLLKSPPSPTLSPRPRSSVSRRTSPSPVPSPPESHRNHRTPLGVPSISPFLAPPLLYPSPYLPHHSAPPPHPYYSPLHSVPPSYRGSPSHSPVPSPLWLHYPLSSLPREALYPGLMPPCHPPPMSHWGPAITHHPMADIKKDDTCSDVPLNLSKHAG